MPSGITWSAGEYMGIVKVAKTLGIGVSAVQRIDKATKAGEAA